MVIEVTPADSVVHPLLEKPPSDTDAVAAAAAAGAIPIDGDSDSTSSSSPYDVIVVESRKSPTAGVPVTIAAACDAVNTHKQIVAYITTATDETAALRRTLGPHITTVNPILVRIRSLFHLRTWYY